MRTLTFNATTTLSRCGIPKLVHLYSLLPERVSNCPNSSDEKTRSLCILALWIAHRTVIKIAVLHRIHEEGVLGGTCSETRVSNVLFLFLPNPVAVHEGKSEMQVALIFSKRLLTQSVRMRLVRIFPAPCRAYAVQRPVFRQTRKTKTIREHRDTLMRECMTRRLSWDQSASSSHSSRRPAGTESQ